MELHPFQRHALDAVDGAIAEGCMAPAVVLPTGSGKTVCFANLAKRVADIGERTLVLVHRDELVRQTVAQLETWAPDIDVGVVKAHRDEVDATCVVASVASLRTGERRARLGTFGRVVVDECHHATATGYRRVLDEVGPGVGVPAVGFTATMMRSDNAHLGDVWERVVFERDILWGVRMGYIVEPKGWTIRVGDLNLDEVATSRGDFSKGALGRAMIGSSASAEVARAWLERAEGRPTVCFCPTVDACHDQADAFRAAGVTAEVVVGTTPVEERQAVFSRVRHGQTSVLVGCGVPTEGWDEPSVSCVVMARPTQSQGLYIQCVGRGLRKFPGKEDCVVLDVVGMSRRHSLVGFSDLSASKKPREAKIGDGESLLDAVKRWEEEYEEEGRLDLDEEARLELEEVDLFGSSRSAWNETYGGTWFTMSPKRVYFLVEGDDGLYNVRASASTRHLGKPALVAEGVPMSVAMGIADGLRSDDSHMTTRRVVGSSSDWMRKRNMAPDRHQLVNATSKGLLVVDRNGAPILENGFPRSRRTGEPLNRAGVDDEIAVDMFSRWVRRYGL